MNKNTLTCQTSQNVTITVTHKCFVWCKENVFQPYHEENKNFT